jgi:ABC-2 type transport system permease protein
LFVLLWAAFALDVTWTPAKAALVALSVFGGACLFYGLFVLQATLSFWTVESLEIINTVTYGGTETAQYPLTIYRSWFRMFFTFVIPLACINYLPASLILERPHALLDPAPWKWATPLVGVVFLFVSLRLWNFGVRHYCSTGS